MLGMLTYPRLTTGSEEEVGAAVTDSATESTAEQVQKFSIMMLVNGVFEEQVRV